MNKPAITPNTQSVRSKPIDANVSDASASVQHHVAEILKLRIIRMVDICDLRSCHVCCCGSGVIDELIGLVRTDVAENAAVALRIPEPVGPRPAIWLVDLVRAQDSRSGRRVRSPPPLRVRLPLPHTFTSRRSEYMMPKMRFVSLMVLRTSASCSSVVMAGLVAEIILAVPHHADTNGAR